MGSDDIIPTHCDDNIHIRTHTTADTVYKPSTITITIVIIITAVLSSSGGWLLGVPYIRRPTRRCGEERAAQHSAFVATQQTYRQTMTSTDSVSAHYIGDFLGKQPLTNCYIH